MNPNNNINRFQLFGNQALYNHNEDEIKKNYFSINNIDLKDLYNDEVIQEQTINLIKSLGTQWYKCPNGHLYSVGECGRPMEESRCPECQAKIGGIEHIPARNNVQANIVLEMRNNNNIINNADQLLNQDEVALNNMNRRQRQNDVHQMDDDIRQMMADHPEWMEYN